MQNERLSAWFAADYDGAVKDVLAGKERILPLGHVQHYPCRTRTACHFAAMNFVRGAFGHMQRARGSTGPSIARWLRAIMQRRVLEEMLAPCGQLTGERTTIQLEEMYRVPLFERTLVHVSTQHSPPSMILLKHSLRQMQLHGSPVLAMVVSRNASTTVCLKFREGFTNVFLVVDFALAPPEQGRGSSTTLALVISASLEQIAARMSGILPVDNHLVTRDRQWQAQLFSSCTICMFSPGNGILMSLVAEEAAMREGIALLRFMKEVDDRERDWERGRGASGSQNRGGRQGDRPSDSNYDPRGLWEKTPLDVGGVVPTTSRTEASHAGSLGEGSSSRIARLRPRTTFAPYEQTKRYARIFFLDDELSPPTSTSPSPPSLSSEGSDEESYFECLICFENVPEDEGIRLPPCAHGFCRGCLVGHVCAKIDERKFPVFCPLCMTEQRNTNPSVMSGALVRRLGVSGAQYAIWSELELAHFSVRVHCRRCKRLAFVDRKEYEQLEELRCPFPRCRHTWCKKCQRGLWKFGPKHSCDGRKELNNLVKKMKWKYCPACRTPVQKSGGCNHMTCVTPGCNTHFCYQCGKEISRASSPFAVSSAVTEHFKKCAR